MNYKITFSLKTPICLSDNIMFDGLIAYSYAQEMINTQNGKLSFDKDELIDFSGMPIVQHKDGYFMASWMFWKQESVQYIDSWKKRWSNEYDEYSDFGKNKRKVRINSSEFKSYNTPIPILDIDECWFYFQSDNLFEVSRLLDNNIIALGKKISQGYGIIDSWSISELDYDPFTNIIRPIPAKEKDVSSGNCNVEYRSWKPPYWLPDNFDYCISAEASKNEICV